MRGTAALHPTSQPTPCRAVAISPRPIFEIFVKRYINGLITAYINVGRHLIETGILIEKDLNLMADMIGHELPQGTCKIKLL